MELPRLNYEDFYKFLMSLGLILIVMATIGVFFLLNDLLSESWILILLIIGLILIFISGVWIIIWAGRKWYANQRLLDKKLKTEVKLIEREASRIVKPEENIEEPRMTEREGEETGGVGRRHGVALVSCKISSVLPNSITFNFLQDWKVWFWIVNHDPKKYKAYVKIKFIANGLEKELTNGYYGGTQAWKLDAFSGIQAPGLDIPEEIKVAAQEGKRIKIQINCTVKDESDNFVEEKFPQTYVYDPQNNNWFLEP